jgi:hypothetical protein
LERTVPVESSLLVEKPWILCLRDETMWSSKNNFVI